MLVRQGLGGFELVIDLISRSNKVLGYEVHCLHLRNIVGPAHLERFVVTENRLEENPPRGSGYSLS